MESQSPSAAFPFQAILPESGETPPLVHSFPWSNQLGSNTKFGATQLGANYLRDTILGYILSRQGDNNLRFEYKRLFHLLAKKYSVCPSGKKKGGDLGEFNRGQMVAQFDKVCFTGEVLKPHLVISLKRGV